MEQPPRKKRRTTMTDPLIEIENVLDILINSFKNTIEDYINHDNLVWNQIESNPLLKPEANTKKFCHLKHGYADIDMRLLYLPKNIEDCWSPMTSKLMERITPNYDIQSRLAILLGVSGCGKTRTLFEALCFQYGLFFDLSTFAGKPHYEIRLASKSFDSRNEALQYFETVFLSRLLILLAFMKVAKKQKKIFHPMHWLSFQIHSNHQQERALIKTAFKETNTRIDLLEPKDTFDTAKELFNSFRSEVHPNAQKQDVNLLVCVDEAYMLLNEDRFVNQEGELRSLLSPLVMSSIDLDGILLCLAGTNTELAKVTKEAESAVNKKSTSSSVSQSPESDSSESDDSFATPPEQNENAELNFLNKPYILTGFQPISFEFINKLCYEFIKSDILNFKPTNSGLKSMLELVHQCYEGSRPRAFMNFLWNALISRKDKFMQIKFLEPYRKAYRKEQDKNARRIFLIFYGTIYQTVFGVNYTSTISTVRRFLRSSLRFKLHGVEQGPAEILGFILERYLFFSNDLPFHGEYVDELINNSICFLRQVDGEPKVEVSEFLLIEALQKLRQNKEIILPHENILQSTLCTSQVNGKYAQYIFAEKLFTNLASQSLSNWPVLKDMELPSWCQYTSFQAQSFQADHVSNLSNSITDKEYFEYFLFPEDAAGPDIVFYLINKETNESHLALSQCKVYQTALSGNTADKCISTTSPEGTYMRGSTQQSRGKTLTKEVKETFPQGILRLLIVYPQLAESERRISHSHVEGDDVILIIDQSNFLEFFDNEMYNLLLSHTTS